MDGVTFHALEARADGVLWEVQPDYVIMVDLDLAFVRQLEVRMCLAGTIPTPQHADDWLGWRYSKRPYAQLADCGVLCQSPRSITSRGGYLC